MKVLFICSSNVCRSPFSEFVFKRMVSNDKQLSQKVQSVRSAAVLNKSRKLHPKAFVSLVSRGFDKKDLLAFHPSYVLTDRRLFEEADIIVGMAKVHKFLLPCKYKSKFRLLSSVAGQGEKSIPDPFLKKSQADYEQVMDVLEAYLKSFAQRIVLNEE